VHNDTSTLTAAELIKSLNLPAETETNLTLPATLAEAPGTAITWTSNETSLIENNGAVHPDKRDLRNQDVTLTATLTYNSTTVHKTFIVALKRLTKITRTYGPTTETWIFTDTEMERTEKDTGSNPSKNGSRFSYKNLDTTRKTFTACKTHEICGGMWYEIGSASHKAFFMQLPGMTEELYRERVNKITTPITYTYQILYSPPTYETVFFSTEGPYDNSKQWFKQDGLYMHSGPLSGYIEFRIWNGAINYFFYNGKRYYTGSLNPEGTVFTGTVRGSSDSITVTITDNRNKTISIMVGSESYTLYFRGESLL